MLDGLIETIAAGWRADRLADLLAALWREERWFDTPRQLRAARIARDALAEANLADVQVVNYPADGRTRFQDWITRMAWDCPAARLTLPDGAVLADRGSQPASVVMWSGPLGSAAAPVRAPVVDGDALETVAPSAVAGKFVLTAKNGAEMKRRLIGCRPAAVISDFLRTGNGYDEDTVSWTNTWSDRPGGWYVHADDGVMAGFNLSPSAGKRLRRRLAAEPALQLTGFCDARVYPGVGQNVTAVLPGLDGSREVWIFAHACEQGASDNCSGVAIIVEALRLLKELIDAGRLPRPRLSIRAVTTEECLGMLAFGSMQPRLLERAVVGLNVDAVGAVTLPDRPVKISFGPLSSPTIGWPAAGIIAAALAGRSGGAYHARCKNAVISSDDMIADPNCGVPAMWLGQGSEATGYHSSADTPEVCPEASLVNNGVLVTAWAYAMAAMDDPLAGELVARAGEWIAGNVLRDGEGDPAALQRWAAGGILRSLARWGVSPGVYEPAAGAYCPAGAPPLPGLPTAGPRYARSTWGTCTFETLSEEPRKDFSRWAGPQNSALYWTDGRRPLPAVARLAAAELRNPDPPDLAPLFEACVEAGIAQRVE